LGRKSIWNGEFLGMFVRPISLVLKLKKDESEGESGSG